MDKKQIIEDYLQGRHPMEQHSWELPSAQELERDEALFESLVPQKKALKRIRLWPLAVAACVAGFVAIFLAPPREANVEPEKQPVVAEQKEKQEELAAYLAEDDYERDSTGSIGLKNIQQRLTMFCGKDYRLVIESKEGEGTLIKIPVPKKFSNSENEEGSK